MSEANVVSGLPAAQGGSNETVTAANEPITLSAGEAVSFDQLDAVQSNTANLPKEPEKANKKAAKETKSAEKKEEEDDSSDEKPEKKADAKQAVEKDKKPAKIYKVKLGEKLVDVSADGSIEIEKDGKAIPVTVQDLVNDFHGKSEISRRLTEIDLNKKRNEADRKTIDSFVDKMSQFYRDDKPLEAVDFILSTAGLDPAIYRMKLLEQLAPEVEAMSTKTPEEKKAYHLELENQYLKRQQQNRDAELAKSKELSAIEQQVAKVRQSRNLDEKQFYQLYRELVDLHGKNENELTPEDVAEYADRKMIEGHITEQIKATNPEYEEIEALTAALADEMLSNSSLTIEDLGEIIKSIASDSSEEQVKEKLKETKKATQPKNPQSEPVTFDDLM